MQNATPTAVAGATAPTADLFHVVRNAEEQYSIWPTWRDLPLGWDSVGEAAPREACLDWIEKNWTDMRPLSVRRFLQQQGQSERA